MFGMNVDEFLNHNTSGGGSRNGFLHNWKSDRTFTAWLHRRIGITPVWFHPWPKSDHVEDRETKRSTLKTWTTKWGCWEREQVLQKQRFRDNEGNRELPPEICPECLLNAWLEEQVDAGAIDWREPIFRFPADAGDKILRAGGMYGAFNRKDNTEDELKELAEIGITQKDAWMHSMLAMCKYLVAVVSDRDPGAGVQLDYMTPALADRMKKAIRDEIKRAGRDKSKGDPSVRPYPFEWSFDERASFDKKYDVVALTEQPTQEVLDLISGEPPDISRLVAKGNIGQLRSEMEQYALIELPFDELFAKAEARARAENANVDAEAARREFETGSRGPTHDVRTREPVKPKETTAVDRVIAKAAAKKEAAAKPIAKVDPKTASEPTLKEAQKGQDWVSGDSPAATDDDDVLRCDHCDTEMADTDLKCGECGTEYENLDGEFRIAARPCMKCKAIVPIPAGDERVICPKDATIHTVGTWEVWEAPAEVPTRRRTRTAKPTEAKPTAARR